MFTAIVLDSESQNECILRAIALGLLPNGHPAKCHHVTLAMGKNHRSFRIGEARTLEVTHFGVLEGRVSAFRVLGADDSLNDVPHVTIAVYGDAKPKESNDITEWREVASRFLICGKVEICD